MLLALLLVVSVVCLMSLAGCSYWQEYHGSEWEEKDKKVWLQMRDVQLAAEHYAGDHGGNTYPTTIDHQFKKNILSGKERGQKANSFGLVNAFTGAQEWPMMGDITNIMSVRLGNAPKLLPGKIEYSPIGSGKGYAIIGGAHDAKALRDYNGQVLVFTNFMDEELTGPN